MFGLARRALLTGGGAQTLVDVFNRANTSAGDLGLPTLPAGFSGDLGAYQVRGASIGSPAYPNPVADTGFIEDGSFGGASNKVVYVTKKAAGKIVRFSGVLRWKSAGAGDISTGSSIALLISPVQTYDPAHADNVIYNAVHVVFTRNGGRVEKLINGAAPVEISNVNWGSPYLPKDVLFPFDFSIDPTTGSYILFYAGKVTMGLDAALIPLVGPYFTFEHFSTNSDPDCLGRLDQVHARTAQRQAGYTETELLPIGTMASDAGWTYSNPPFNFTSGLVVKSAGTEGSLIPTAPLALVNGARYMVCHERQYASGSGGAALVGLGGANGTARLDDGSDTRPWCEDITVSNPSINLTYYANAPANGYIDNVSVRRVFA